MIAAVLRCLFFINFDNFPVFFNDTRLMVPRDDSEMFVLFLVTNIDQAIKIELSPD